MHFPSTLTLSLLLLLLPLPISADEIELTPSDIPTPCWPICGSSVGITEGCYHQYYDSSSSAEISCICKWTEAPILLPLCEACIANYRSEQGDSDVHDNASCSLSTTTWNPAAATSVMNEGTHTASATTTTTAGGSSGEAGSGGSALSSSTSTSSTGSGSGAQETGNVASGVGGPGVGLVSLVVSLAVGVGLV
ncbi:hypothetical protein BO78DRAFT_385733 [Aspergillus sclerotiicarbonarius CBS 121057]|uniref:GPI anchored protein n=1 Tax=Aspergillus sclerotiicarbonarius (strain CBS 121057 / IBT 28362) TaxID=1448318 RepID=A0A319ECB1_ASPSB|nr:hypothetical protein BO78DRAFT_385733 [Aspergillus sclerotiicarbonarius CBS 121057]